MTLVKYGAPAWLRAVVFQESGCDPLAGSPVGARGLWQFMAESARAYGLLVNEKGDVDERLSPVKSTDAAIHFLMDLHTNLGSWDLALAGYNMGPYGLILRIAQLGGHAGFWDMRRSDLLPAETADYVPSIEAFALILENRRSLGFPIDVPLPESTAELNAKPGTRLSLIARVARTSTAKIEEFNLDFLGHVVPSGETSVRVPLSSEQVLQVQEALDNWPPEDTRDTCVPPDYVWGSGDFETSPYAKKCAR
jgi:membrane-bound lytic murein transglycosylase D